MSIMPSGFSENDDGTILISCIKYPNSNSPLGVSGILKLKANGDSICFKPCSDTSVHYYSGNTFMSNFIHLSDDRSVSLFNQSIKRILYFNSNGDTISSILSVHQEYWPILFPDNHAGFYSVLKDTLPATTNLRAANIVHYDSSGSVLWNKWYHLPKNISVTNLTMDSSGNIFLCGQMTVIWHHGWPLTVDTSKILSFVWKLNSSGDSVWMRYIPEAIDSSRAINHIDLISGGRILVTGNSFTAFIPHSGDTYQDEWAEILDSTGTPVLYTANIELPKSNLIIYPDPVSDLLHIRIQNLSFRMQNFSIRNILGELMADSQMLNMNSGDEFILDVSHYPKGMYFLIGENSCDKFLVE